MLWLLDVDYTVSILSIMLENKQRKTYDLVKSNFLLVRCTLFVPKY
jgi:hypothetical protein